MENETKNSNQIITIPNILSFFRLALIPFIVWVYCWVQDYYIALGLIALSALTDIVDGFIARKFNMVSEFGKILDPIADKFTQGAVIICLITRYRLMIVMVIVFAVKELIMVLMGMYTIRHYGEINSAKWYGKLNTVILYATMMALVIFPNIGELTANILIIVCMVSLVLSLLLYVNFYTGIWRDKKEKAAESGEAETE